MRIYLCQKIALKWESHFMIVNWETWLTQTKMPMHCGKHWNNFDWRARHRMNKNILLIMADAVVAAHGIMKYFSRNVMNHKRPSDPDWMRQQCDGPAAVIVRLSDSKAKNARIRGGFWANWKIESITSISDSNEKRVTFHLTWPP